MKRLFRRRTKSTRDGPAAAALEAALADADAGTTPVKAILLGAGGSGKSTVLRHISVRHGSGYPIEQRRSFVPLILQTVGEAVNAYYESREAQDLFPPANPQNHNLDEAFLSGDFEWSDGERVATLIRVANDPGFRKYLAAESEETGRVKNLRAVTVLVSHLDKYLRADAVPTDEELLTIRIRTTGIIEQRFALRGIEFSLYDVGGQRNERKKWIHIFENVGVVVFMINVANYSSVLFEDESTLRIHEALSLWSEISNSRWFQSTSKLVFFNAISDFERRCTMPDATPFSEIFPGEYTGPERDPVKYLEFLADKVEAAANDSGPLAIIGGDMFDISATDRLVDTMCELVARKSADDLAPERADWAEILETTRMAQNAGFRDQALARIAKHRPGLSVEVNNLMLNSGDLATIWPKLAAVVTRTNKLSLSGNLLDDSIASSFNTVLSSAAKQKDPLSTIDLSANCIGSGRGEIPLSFAPIAASLRVLDLSYNNLGQARPELFSRLIESAPSLVSLNLAANGLGDDRVASLLATLAAQRSKITELNLSANNISTLPALPASLLVLVIARNKFTDVPPSLEDLPDLQVLEINNNSGLKRFPASLMPLLERLAVIDTKHCSWLSPPTSIMDRSDPEVILKYMANIANEGATTSYDLRIMAVGQGEVGKTSLFRALRDGRTGRIAREERTVGIDTHRWGPRHKDVELGLSFWDFAGQDVYLSQHQFFLSRRVLFLLVWNVADDRPILTMIRDWINSLQCRVPGARVMLIGTHADDVPKHVLQERVDEVNRVVKHLVSTEMRQWLRDIEVNNANVESLASPDGVLIDIINAGESLVVDCLSGRGVPEARQAVLDAAMEFSHMGESIPRTWALAQSSLRQADFSPPLVEYDAYAAYCAESGVKGPEDLDRMTELLHDIGSVMWYRDYGADDSCRPIIVTKPQWIIDVIRAIIAHRIPPEWAASHLSHVRNLEREGVLSRELLALAWQGLVPADRRKDLVELLHNFGVLIPVDESNPSDSDLVVPLLLPPGRWEDFVDPSSPAPKADGEYTLVFPALPPGLFHRIIVSCCSFADSHHLFATFGVFKTNNSSQVTVELEEVVESKVHQIVLLSVAAPGSDADANVRRVLAGLQARGADCVLVHLPETVSREFFIGLVADSRTGARFVIVGIDDNPVAVPSALRTMISFLPQPVLWMSRDEPPERSAITWVNSARLDAAVTDILIDTQRESDLYMVDRTTPHVQDRAFVYHRIVVKASGPDHTTLLARVRAVCNALLAFFPGASCSIVTPYAAAPPAGDTDANTDISSAIQLRQHVEPVVGAVLSAQACPVFISYKHQGPDARLAARLREQLEAQGISTWIDWAGIRGGETWRREIASAIVAAKVIVFVKSSASVASRFCEEEVCLGTRLGKPVFPVLCSPCDVRTHYRPRLLVHVGDHLQYWDCSSDDKFDETFVNLLARIREVVGVASDDKAKEIDGAGVVTQLPLVPAAPSPPGAPMLYLAHAPEDRSLALKIASGLAHVVRCALLGAGEDPLSGHRMEQLRESRFIVPVLTERFVSCKECWYEVSVGTGLNHEAVIARVEPVASGWPLIEMELALAGVHEVNFVGVCDEPSFMERIDTMIKLLRIGASDSAAPDAGAGAGAATAATAATAAAAAPSTSQRAPEKAAASWSTEEVGEFLERLGLGKFVAQFQEAYVDGEVLCSLDEKDLREELKLPFGVARKLKLGLDKLE